jgi:serine/threonine-protein kinase
MPSCAHCANARPDPESVAEPLLRAVDTPFGESRAVMPTRIGPFRLVRRIGAGGMGVVYLAEREGADFTQRVALKLLERMPPA